MSADWLTYSPILRRRGCWDLAQPISVVWQHAKDNGFVVVTLDKDFSDLALQRGVPPKIIWLRCGNSTVAEVERLLRVNLKDIEVFETHLTAEVLEIWP